MVREVIDRKNGGVVGSSPETVGTVHSGPDELDSLTGPGYSRFSKAHTVLTGGGLSPDEELEILHKASWELQNGLENAEETLRNPGEILYVTWASKSDRDKALREFNSDIDRAGFGDKLEVVIAPTYAAMLGVDSTSNWKGKIFNELSEDEKDRVRQYDWIQNELKFGGKVDSHREQAVLNSIDFKAQFIKQLESAGIIYGSSGNQERMMELASICGVQDIIVKKILDGELLYAGTSAGAAVAPGMMITPHGLKPGLGIIPEHIAIDQHIDAEGRNRVLRLMDAMLENPAFTIGIGIYEGTSVHIHGPMLTVIGGKNVMYIRKDGDELICKKLSTGESLRLYE